MKKYDDGFEISKNDLIKGVASDTYTTNATVRAIFDAMEQRLYDYLSMASEDKPYVLIKLFRGFVLESKFVPSEKRINNLTGKSIKTKDKIKAKATFNRYYQEALSNHLG